MPPTSKRERADFHKVEPHQHAIHARLANWARWVTQDGTRAAVCPMFRQARSLTFQWYMPEYREVCDTADAVILEKAVSALPSYHRDAVRWAYVVRCTPAIACRALGVQDTGLYRYLRDGRQMLINRLN